MGRLLQGYIRQYDCGRSSPIICLTPAMQMQNKNQSFVQSERKDSPFCNWPGRNKDILKRHCVFQPDYQAIDTKDPKEMGISQESHSGRRKRYQPEQELVSRKEISHSSKEAKE